KGFFLRCCLPLRGRRAPFGIALQTAKRTECFVGAGQAQQRNRSGRRTGMTRGSMEQRSVRMAENTPATAPEKETFRGQTRSEQVLGLVVLADGEHVAVRVFEPGYLVAVGGCPDSEFAILDEGVFFRR